MRAAVIFALFVAGIWSSLALGVQAVGLDDMIGAVLHAAPQTPAELVFMQIRLPRMATGLLAGAAFAMAGVVMQSLTRNPLADPGLLGVNAGAAASVVLAALLTGHTDAATQALWGFPGAMIAAVTIFALGGGLRGDRAPVRLILAGVALNALILSALTALIVLRSDALEVFRFWMAGTLAQGGQKPLVVLAFIVMCGGAIAILLAPALEALALGHGLARGLGLRPRRTQAGALIALTLMTAAGVAAAGPIAFLGLIVPPLARHLAGPQLRTQIAAGALLGPAVLLLADTAGRLLIAPAEIRVGVMTAIIGGPVFIWLARRMRTTRNGAP
ncbi:iron ABC transporter permease [Rhodobacteraceae bacterium]|nr:iron ABC transporter permease [Paracoccaceae bacterium]